LSFAALALAVALLAGCGATVNLRVSVARSGSGSVALVVSFPAATAAQLEDLKAGLPLADLRASGWVVEGPRPGPEGSTVVSASHTFSNLAQVPALVADVAGSGPERSRPFRLSVSELRGLLQDHYLASGTVDLRCWLSCFDDPRLAASVGYPLGLSPAEVHRLFGPNPSDELTFGFEVLLPGTVTSSDASGHASGDAGRNDLVWSPVLGKTTTIFASSKTENTAVVDELGAAVAAGALIVVVTAVSVLWRRRRRRRRGLNVSGRRRGRRPLDPNRGPGRYA
jgi:hypothetical protein